MPYNALLKSVARCLAQGQVSRAAVLTLALMSAFLTPTQRARLSGLRLLLPKVWAWDTIRLNSKVASTKGHLGLSWAEEGAADQGEWAAEDARHRCPPTPAQPAEGTLLNVPLSEYRMLLAANCLVGGISPLSSSSLGWEQVPAGYARDRRLLLTFCIWLGAGSPRDVYVPYRSHCYYLLGPAGQNSNPLISCVP